MFPGEAAHRIPDDIVFAWSESEMAHALTIEARTHAYAANAWAYALNRFPSETLTQFGLTFQSNALYLRPELTLQEGVWLNAYATLPGVKEQWKLNGEAKVACYPIIYPVANEAGTGKPTHMVLNIPQQIMFFGDRLIPEYKQSARKSFLDHQTEVLIEGKPAAILLAEIITRFHMSMNLLLRWNNDITDPYVRLDIADQRKESLREFEAKLAGKRFICVHADGTSNLVYTPDGTTY